VVQQSAEMQEMHQALLRVQNPTPGLAVTAAPTSTDPRPEGPKPATAPIPDEPTAVVVEASGRLRHEIRPRRRLAEPTVCADEGDFCACDGYIYFGNKYASGQPGSGTENTFEQLTAIDFIDQNGPDNSASGGGYTIVSGARLGGAAAECSSAGLGVADPAGGYTKQCWCSTDTVSYAHTSNWLVHEFTADNHQHAALTDGRPKQVLPLGADGATTYNPTPSFTGPVNFTLASVAQDWTTTEVESFPAPLKMVHEAGGGLNPTLEIGLPTSLPRLLGSGANQLVHREAYDPAVQGNWNDWVAGSLTNFISKTITTTLDSTLIFANYQFALQVGGYLLCNLVVDGVEQAGTRSIFGTGGNDGYYGALSGTWVGTVDGAGSHSFQVQCRSQFNSAIQGDWSTQALTILKLGDGASSVDETTASHISL